MEYDNFYIILELPFDPPANDLAQIRAAIHNKHQQWTLQQDDPALRGIALHQLEMIPEMERIMLDATLREEEAEKAKVLRGTMFQRFSAELKVLEAKGYLLPKELNGLHKKYSPYGIGRDDIHKELATPVTDTPPKARFRQELYALEQERMLSLRDNLKIVGADSLYSFLATSPQTPRVELLRLANIKYQEVFQSGERTAEAFAAQVLVEAALSLFEKEEETKRYDLALTVDQYPELNRLISEEHQRSGFVSSEAMVRLVNFGVTSYNTSVLSMEQHIRHYCDAYGFSVDFMHQHMECPHCGAMNTGSAKVCASCAAPLEGECPSCGLPFSGGAAICNSCGFVLANMGRAPAEIVLANTSIIEGNWSAAKRAFAQAKLFWPTNPELALLEERIHELETRNIDYLQAIEGYMEENRYYAAQSLLEETLSRQIRIPGTTVKKIESTIADFELKIEALKEKETASYNTLSDMLSYVSDSIDLERLLAKYPPEPPSRVSAIEKEGVIQVDWNASASSGVIRYILVRKENSVPITAYDGDVLYEGAKHTFLDTTLPPLKSYYYSVFVKRGNSFSSYGAVVPTPALIIPELKNLRMLPADGGAQLTWEALPALSKVTVWRKLGGDQPHTPGEGAELETDRLDGFTDMKLRNGVEYWYYITASYTVGESTYTSRGVSDRITPQELVDPIDQFTISRSIESEHEYSINWEGEPREEVMFLFSREKPSYYLGEIVRTSDLLFSNHRLELLQQTPHSVRFHHEFSGGVYVFPAMVLGKFTVIGAQRYLTNVPNVKNPSYKPVLNDIFITFDWPEEGVNQVAVAWKLDDYPNALNEEGVSVATCSRRQYTLEHGVHIPNLGEGVYYFRIFSTYETSEGHTVYSFGTPLFIDKTPYQELTYQIKYAKPLFSSTYNVTVTVRSPKDFTLPRAVLIGKEHHLPLQITDGTPYFEMEREQPISGSIAFEYKTEKLPDNLFLRLFFYDAAQYKNYRLLPEKTMRLT